ncbi:hypothetical protein BD779DRAFT_1470343 [Infundibulicybe gibba]|nr:hypothetical protein BD779DRAFT_1470343 [Infundibulicybe gibba]
MHMNNPFAQGGWPNPSNPGVGDPGAPTPSVFGALPLAGTPTPPTILTFTFTSFTPNILNCDVYGPRSQRYYSIATGQGPTIFHDAQGRQVALVDWQPPCVEIRGVVTYQRAAQWMPMLSDRSSRSMIIGRQTYTWIPRDGVLGLYSTGPSSELLARICRLRDSAILEITTEALKAGLLEAAVVSGTLLLSGRNIDR